MDLLDARLDQRYVLQDLLGEGGSAKVYRAHDERLGRDVAVKILHDHVHPADRTRFEREIRTLARLAHPGVVSILDLGTFEGRTFFSMPLLSGGPLSTLGPLEDTPESAEVFLDAATLIAQALHHLHDRGLVHRDLTPNNILLDAHRTPRVMDFGLVSSGMSEHTLHLTRSGVTLGTPQYMAPEQARGVNVGPHSDLYALGAVLYRVACGSPPFVGDNDQSVLYQHVYELPDDPRLHNPAVPDEIARLILTLLAKKPEARPESGLRLARQLQRARDLLRRAHSSGQYRGGRARGGEHLGGPLSPGALQEAWAVPLGGEVTWPAAVTGSGPLVTVGTRQGQLAVVNVSGDLHATYTARDEVTAPATFHEGTLVYGAWDGTLRRVRVQDSHELWRHQTRAEITGTPTPWGGRYLVTSRDGHLHSVDGDSGELAWAYRTGGPIAASPVVWGSNVFIADEDGWLHALDATTGTPVFKTQLGTVHATPALAPRGRGEAVLIVPTWNGEVHALHLQVRQGRAHLAADEPLLWTYDVEGEVWASPATAEGLVVIAAWDGQVRALRVLDGEEVWTHRASGRVTASPVISDGHVFLATEDGELSALTLTRGQVRWRALHPTGVQATPLVSDGALYVAFMDGTLRAYREATGQPLTT
ncbi:serine/threonine-protein kinase [Deinococcus maricopensis]|uniref:Serine/threonine protein kinase n=1 Tax=Deinococcus maricopensis (strain DSM 21211 / LMG 22137 / NRRL B-23946 / LB-34) TaxID=709986 RepID=E8U7C3_DEIML|nr:serine/threonine-protein kinase [Deinococcus maricopensis]ADV66962.1 serine/threonine protein kinase [Deinococcus maricopensis DSM 21211]